MADHELDDLLRNATAQMEARRKEIICRSRPHLIGIAILTVIAIALQFLPGVW